MSLLMLLIVSVISSPFAKAQDLKLSTDAGIIAKGQTLFSNNCSSCHDVHKDKVAPMLKDVTERRKLPWLLQFIKAPQKTAATDPVAQELFKKWAPTVMPNQDWASDEDLVAILSYIKDESAKAPGPKDPRDGTGAGAQAHGSSGLVVLLASILGALLFLAFVALVALAIAMRRKLKDREDLTEEAKELIGQGFNVKAFLTSPAFVGIFAFVFVAYMGKVTVDSMMTIGVQQGYAPTQPIPFSHKLHAGYYEIDCRYCHTGVEKSKNANLPSANICMGCHNQIRTTAPNIQKIYDAVEKNQPIQWVRVHNLPDLSYFNHQQHVKVAGLECETCHGDVKNMEVIQQHSLLTMGWCIACHRKTEVNTKDNKYYEKLVKLHATESKKPLTVEDIGGLECGKCHY